MLPGLWRHPPVTSRPSIGQITQQIQSRSRTRRSQSVVTQRLVPSRNHGYIRNLETFQTDKIFIHLPSTNEDHFNEIWETSVPPLKFCSLKILIYRDCEINPYNLNLLKRHKHFTWWTDLILLLFKFKQWPANINRSSTVLWEQTSMVLAEAQMCENRWDQANALELSSPI